MGVYKRRCREGMGQKELLGGCPREFVGMLTYIDSLRYYDTPDYQRVYQQLNLAMASMGVREGDPYDWERRAPF